MSLPEALPQLTAAAGGILAFVAGLVRYGRRGRKAAQRVADALGAVDQILAEMSPNGGGSLRDAIDRVETRGLLTDAKLRILADNDPAAMLIVTDATGSRVTYLAPDLVALSGVDSASQAQPGGWAATIHPDDLQRVSDAWRQAVVAHEVCMLTYRVRNRESGEATPVEALMTPVEGPRGLIGYVGTVRRVL